MRPKRLQIQSGGFSLVEALVAIAVIGVTAAMIPPIVTLSVAARAQNQRIEQAYLAAQGYIDLIRLRMERGLAGTTVPVFVSDLNRLAPLRGEASLDQVPAPSAAELQTAPFCDLRNVTAPVGAPCRLDINGDRQADFGIQAFRIRQRTTPDGMPIAFAFGVRVYPRAVVRRIYNGPLGTQPATIRLGAPESASNPLAVQYGRVFVPDSSLSLGSLCITLGGTDCPR